ncbi:Serine/threonine-protein kinase [Suhomyces tanzawaensis NRRL Y-17324]|uniref:non-specific serine/threonine protein kinase n=1 Tax=Suhomyces tanzawaensis NRRL Y-17324 TaxID=984487 RepID=A0A1E4SRM0_9ASCO|nr:Serine/threonine-protein kinase [Suhomyces tanzawaensis NRRL Y-17324]ODV82087.1 Serine/threonine-protein kinase [Suhomyces tanzawaensis NRRL Y-17324]
MEDVSISLACEIRQLDEVNSIASIYGDIFTNITPSGLVWNKKPCPHFQISLESCNNKDRPTLSLTLDIEFTQTYPLTPPIVKLLHPKNLLKVRIGALESRIKELIKEYPEEEVSFTIISEVKYLLDEFQQVTEKVLSLEEEREERLKKQRAELEKNEAKKQLELEVAQKKQNEDLNRQILKIQGEYDNEASSNHDNSVSLIVDDELIPTDPTHYFVFENSIVGDLPGSRVAFKFKAVLGFIKYNKNDLLSSIGTQNIVKPYLPKEVQSKIDKQGIELSYLLTEIDFDNAYYNTDQGKREIQDLETELQLILNVNHDNISKLYGFQIDKKPTNGWKVRLLTEFSSASDSLQDILPTAEFINWALARTWVIQLLPALEYLHNAGFVHKTLCPLTVFVHEMEIDAYESASDDDNEILDHLMSTKIHKISHPSYGFRLLNMIHTHPNPKSTETLRPRKGSNNEGLIKGSYTFIPKDWIAPELATGSHHQKTDIWDLGVLLMRVMLNYNVLLTTFKTPQSFHADFKVEDFSGVELYAALVYDFLSKLLQQKIAKRPSPLELNAVKFLRDGPIIMNNQNLSVFAKYTHPVVIASEVESKPIDTKGVKINRTVGRNEVNTLVDNFRRQTLASVQSTGKRRYSNNQRPYFGDTQQTGSLRNAARFQRDFEEVGKLGKGGFGEVVKARNRIEGTFYAIKKIKHRADKLDSLLSEVLSLARLNHQFIVRYYGTWVEELEDSSAAIESDDLESESESEFDPINARSSSFLRSHDSSFQVDYITNSFDPQIDFGSLSDDNLSSDGFEFANSDDLGTIEDDSEEETSNSTSKEDGSKGALKDKALKLKEHNPKSILYIQMEFCENNTLLNLIEQGLPGNSNEYWRLFRQILEAVSYIHGEGFIHRDLKPMNIFIDKSNNVKVGDFGLAKNSQFASVVLTNNQVNSTNKDYSTIVGTLFYTAKEVATGDYDEKVDMYSLGIILFEMCYSLSTGMERAMILNNLRLQSVDFPSNFTESKYHTEKKIVRLLLDHDPKTRPGASQLLQSGWLPVEHQDQVIKEALKSLADPASPWQQQVRQTLFNQPYLLAKDLMFDNYSKNSHIHHLEHSTSDYLIFSKMIQELFTIFHNHGAIEDYASNILAPKTPAQSSELVYELLDKSGSVLSLPYDLILPTARFLSRNNVTIPKLYRHEFVYRPNLRGSGIPDKYSTVSLDIVTSDPSTKASNDAECLKIIDEILHSFPCFKTKNSQALIIINHYDILDAIISYSFGNIGIDEKKRHEVIGILSQLGIDKSTDEVKRILREDIQIPHTVTKDLIDGYNFTSEPEKVRQKIQKLMIDSPHLIKVEKSFAQIMEILLILKKLGVRSPIYMNPLSNYNSKYYGHGIMFQAVFKVDKNRRFSRIATGGRYDNLISAFTNKDIAKLNTPYSVGFSLSSTFIFLLMKNLLSRKVKGDIKVTDLQKWRGNRCDVLISSLNESFFSQFGYEILRHLWSNGISCDLFKSNSQDDMFQKAHIDGANWVVIIKQSISLVGSKKKKVKLNRNFKPIKVRNICTGKDIDLEYEELVKHLKEEIEERNGEQSEAPNGQDDSTNLNTNDDLHNEGKSSSNLQDLNPLYSIDINQKVIVVPNDAPRGRKNNKKEKWELENDSKVASAELMRNLSSCTVLTVDARDEVLDMIAITSISQPDEWLRKVIFSANNIPKSYAMNIYNTLTKEASKGQKWVVLHSPKTQKTTMVDLQR